MNNDNINTPPINRMRKNNNTPAQTALNNRWGKRILVLLTLLLATSSLSAQNFMRRGFAFGADRDTLLYIIASPFDNWFLTVGGGPQTFIGNELHASARHNKLNYNIKAEIGKWIIPDLSISLRLSYFSVDGQSRYGLQPFIDFTDVPVAVDPDDGITYYEYQPYHAHALGIIGYVTLDWTNFFKGYEIGRRSRTHIFTPIGLGFSALHGKQVNPRGIKEVGEMRVNWELSYSLGIGAEYVASQELAFSAMFDLVGSESTWDWSPYDNSYSRFDIMPTLTFGVRFNLLKEVVKRNVYTKVSKRSPVYHEFLTVGGRQELSTIRSRIVMLNNMVDSLENQADVDSAMLAGLRDTIEALQGQLDSQPEAPATNVMEALLQNDLALTVVYFDLDKYNIDRNARYRLRRFAKSMEQAPDTLEYYIIGAADSLTGSKRHNDWLSEKRCKAAYDVLVNDYGADPNQLTIVPVGGITAYEPKEENRMAMIVYKSKEADAIIEQWSRYKK